MAYNVLIVDDSAVTRAIIARTLRMAGLQLGDTLEAPDGKKALELLETHWVDIVFADINMPVMNGVEMIDEMSRRGILPSTPVVIISTEKSLTRIQELKAKGVRAYLNKPFTPENIKQVVDKLLGDGK